MAVAFSGCKHPNVAPTAATCTVTFDLNYGGAPAGQTITAVHKATEPAFPTKGTEKIAGWYKEAACTNKWNFTSDTVTENRTLYAKWGYEVGDTGPAGGKFFM